MAVPGARCCSSPLGVYCDPLVSEGGGRGAPPVKNIDALLPLLLLTLGAFAPLRAETTPLLLLPPPTPAAAVPCADAEEDEEEEEEEISPVAAAPHAAAAAS